MTFPFQSSSADGGQPQGKGNAVLKDERTIMLEEENSLSPGGKAVVTNEEQQEVWRRFVPLPNGPDHRTVPGCTLEAVLGTGGMGAVYLGRQDRLDRPVAVKVLNNELANNPEFIARLRQEAKILGAMAHPNVVACHDIIVSKSGASLVMEYVPGQLSGRNVVQLLGPMPERYVVEVLLGVARALNYAWEKGFTHRDVKPDNILLGFDARRPPDNYDELFHHPDFRVALCDFGIAAVNARFSHEKGKDEKKSPIMGSPLYMAPEQAVMPEKTDFRADIYALGCTGYYLLSGAPPFQGKSWNEILDQKVEHDIPMPPLPKGRHLSPALQRVLGKMGTVLPEKRYESYDALLKELNGIHDVYAERERGFRTFFYAHQRALTTICSVVLIVLLGALGGVNYYTHWLQNYQERMDPQMMNLLRWNGDRNGWQQRLDEGTGRQMLIGERGGGAITMDEVLLPGGFVHLQMSCTGGSIGIQLRTASEESQLVGRISLRHEQKDDVSRYHVSLLSVASDNSEGMDTRVVPTPPHFPDEGNEWVELRIEIYEKFYCVWNRRQLLGVGHFEAPKEPAGYCLEVGPVTCERVTFRNILLIEEDVAKRLRNW
ncbi:MAG: serine/threonine protein kinase [Victivallales bacterium]|nr:serine/threonine protein kinase [Victivallales bacterium]